MLTLSLVLSACGFTDSVGNNFNIYIEGDHEDSWASLGILGIGENARLTFQIKKPGQDPVDYTAAATFFLSSEDAKDTPTHFNLGLSTNLNTQPYHTVNTYAYEVQTHVCATYDGSLATDGPVRVCRMVMTMTEEEYEEYE